MKTLKILLALLFCTLVTTPLLAQTDSTANVIYKEAVDLYNQNRLQEAVAMFEETIALDPRHKNALFNLAVINLGAGNTEKGIDYLQTGVRLNDREAANMLRKLNRKIAYSDTMNIDFVDVMPKVTVNSSQEDLILNGTLNPAVLNKIMAGFKRSNVIRKDARGSKRYSMLLTVDKTGKLSAELLKPQKPAVAQEIAAILQAIPNITPAMHDGKEVTAWGILLSLAFDYK